MEGKEIPDFFWVSQNLSVQKTDLDFKTELKKSTNTSFPKLSSDAKRCNFHYFHLFFKVGYYLCIMPFCPFYDTQSGSYRLKTNKLQKTLCFTSWTFALIYRQVVIRQTWQTTGKHPTIFYFNVVHSWTHLILNIIFYWTLLCKDEIETMIQIISDCQSLHQAEGYRQKWIIVFITNAMWVLQGFINPIVGYSVIKSSDWTPSWWLQSYVARAKYTFLLHNNITLSTIRQPLSDNTPLETFLGIFQVLVNGSHDIQLRVMISAFGMCCITIWTASDSFEKVVKSFDNHKEDVGVFYRKFCSLRDLCDSINKVWHLYCYWYILDITVWLATDLDRALRTNDWYLKVYMVYFMFYDGTVIALSAESFRKMCYVRQWIVSQVTLQFWKRRDVKFMLQEVTESTIGVGSPGFYHVDYAFVSQISVMVVTFFIISIQYA